MYDTWVKGRLRPFGFYSSARFSHRRPLSNPHGVAKTCATPDSGRVDAPGDSGRVDALGAIPDVPTRFPGQRQRGQVMAEQEMKAANETYAGFISLFKVGTIITVVVAAFVVLLIS
jgi:hypothetical protein